MARGIIFNGSSQYAQVTLPNSAPWTSLGAFKIVFRVRALSGTDGMIINFADSGGTNKIYIHGGQNADPDRIDFTDARGSGAIFHVPFSLNDEVCKIQFDPANSRWTFESWKSDGGGYVSGTDTTLTDTSNWDMGNWILSLGANFFGAAKQACKLDWVYVQEGADTLSQDAFPGPEPPAGTTLVKYTFDSDDGADSSGNSLTLTLTGTPTFEDTPLVPPPVPYALRVIAPIPTQVKLNWIDRAVNEDTFRIERIAYSTPTLKETFTATDNTELSTKTSDSGHSWAQPSYANLALCYINSNRLTKDNDPDFCIYYSNATLNDDQIVEGTLVVQSYLAATNSSLLLCLQTGENAFYQFRHNRDTNQWRILKQTVAGGSVSLGEWNETLAAGAVRRVRFERRGSNLYGYIDGVLRITASDSAITGGKAGVRFAGAASSTTGYGWDDVIAYNAPTWSEIGSVNANVKTYTDNTVSANTSYVYRIRARNTAGDSVYTVEERVKTPPIGKVNFRVATFNTFFNTGTDNVHDIDRTAQFIADLMADVVCCQEMPQADISTLESAIETKTGVTWYSYDEGLTNGSTQRNIIFSRSPLSSTALIYLSNSRSAIKAEVSIQSFAIPVVTTHLQNGQTPENAAIRETQLSELLPWMANFGAKRMLTGDLNAQPASAEIATTVEADYDSAWSTALTAGTANSYPANPVGTNTRTHAIHIDYICLNEGAGSDITVRQAYIPDSRDLTYTGVSVTVGTTDDNGVRPSDHNILIVDFDVTQLSQAGPGLFRGRSFPFFDDEEVNRYEFWPAIGGGAAQYPSNITANSLEAVVLGFTPNKVVPLNSAETLVLLRQMSKEFARQTSNSFEVQKTSGKVLSVDTASPATLSIGLVFSKIFSLTSTPVPTIAKALEKLFSLTSSGTPTVSTFPSKLVTVSSAEEASVQTTSTKTLGPLTAFVATIIASPLIDRLIEVISNSVSSLLSVSNKIIQINSAEVPSVRTISTKDFLINSQGTSTLLKTATKATDVTATGIPTATPAVGVIERTLEVATSVALTVGFSISKLVSITSAPLIQLFHVITSAFNVSSANQATVTKNISGAPLAVQSNEVPTVNATRLTGQIDKLVEVSTANVVSVLAQGQKIAAVVAQETATHVLAISKLISEDTTNQASVSLDAGKSFFVQSSGTASTETQSRKSVSIQAISTPSMGVSVSKLFQLVSAGTVSAVAQVAVSLLTQAIGFLDVKARQLSATFEVETNAEPSVSFGSNATATVIATAQSTSAIAFAIAAEVTRTVNSVVSVLNLNNKQISTQSLGQPTITKLSDKRFGVTSAAEPQISAGGVTSAFVTALAGATVNLFTLLLLRIVKYPTKVLVGKSGVSKVRVIESGSSEVKANNSITNVEGSEQ